MMAVYTLIAVLLLPMVCETMYLRHSKTRCEPLQESMCRGLNYTKTFFPNGIGLADQGKAKRVFKDFHPLISAKCFQDMRLFLCSIFFPICTNYPQRLMPCRSLCKKAKGGCLPIMQIKGFRWPPVLKCNQFPRAKDVDVCIDRPEEKNKKEKKKWRKKNRDGRKN